MKIHKIALLNILKLLENRLQQIMEKLLSKSQGFMEGHSIQEHIFLLQQIISKGKNQQKEIRKQHKLWQNAEHELLRI